MQRNCNTKIAQRSIEAQNTRCTYHGFAKFRPTKLFLWWFAIHIQLGHQSVCEDSVNRIKHTACNISEYETIQRPKKYKEIERQYANYRSLQDSPFHDIFYIVLQVRPPYLDHSGDLKQIAKKTALVISVSRLCCISE